VSAPYRSIIVSGFDTMTKFIPGHTYIGRSPYSDHAIVVHVMRRTAMTIRGMIEGKWKVFRITEHDGVETIKPWGSYSMAPIVSADRVAP
jgi:hypothetical protein